MFNCVKKAQIILKWSGITIFLLKKTKTQTISKKQNEITNMFAFLKKAQTIWNGVGITYMFANF